MRGHMLLVVLLILVLTIYVLHGRTSEGFESAENLAQDRANPLALAANPLNNPSAKIGIPEAQAASLRNMAIGALGGNTRGTSDVSPRIDSEFSYLGLITFCKERGAQPNPFSDAKFRKFCGVCTTSGMIKDLKHSFNTPTGVLVYEKDKDVALQVQKDTRAPFPRVIPSLNSATCSGASMGDTAQPVLAITEKDYNAFMKRADCVKKGTVDGTGCGSCLPNKKVSFVDRNAGIQTLSLILFGEGMVTVLLSNRQIGDPQRLSMTQGVEIQLGAPREGSVIRMNTTRETQASMTGPSLFGAMKGTNSNDTPYFIDIYDMIEKNVQTGARPPAGKPQTLPGVPISIVRINPPMNAAQMQLEGNIPLTFTQWNELASFDCPNGPYVTTQASAEMFVRDPCLRPKGQGPLQWTDACIQSKLEENKAASGTWYNKPQEALALWRKETNTANIRTSGEFFTSFANWLRGLVTPSGATPARVETDIPIALGVRGVDLRTPCDPYLNTNQVPNQECMKYLWKNQGAMNRRVGPTFAGFEDYADPATFEEAFTTMATARPSEAGTLNPATDTGLTEATKVAVAPGQGTPLQKIMNLYQTTFRAANDKSRPVRVANSQGGRLNSYQAAYGTPVVQAVETPVSTNAKKKVLGEEASSCIQLLPSMFSPQRNRAFANSFMMRRDYTLSFTITIRSVFNAWMNIFHMSQGADFGKFGDRALAVWIFPNRPALHVRFDNQAQLNNGIDTDNLPLNQPIQFVLEQRGPNTTLIVNNKTYKIVAASPRYQGNVAVWGSDPWWPSANVSVSDFCLTFL